MAELVSTMDVDQGVCFSNLSAPIFFISTHLELACVLRRLTTNKGNGFSRLQPPRSLVVGNRFRVPAAKNLVPHSQCSLRENPKFLQNFSSENNAL
jgi:hypothetical protein